mgnify:FL=1|jgi:hypothetical protein
MNTYYYESNSVEHLQGNFIEAESAPKAKYLIWINGASEYYASFSDFLKDVKVRKVNKE